VINQYLCTSNGDAMEVSNYTGPTSGAANPAAWYIDWASGDQRSDAGVVVNGYTALTHCPLWQGVNIIAGDLGQVPIRLVKDEFYDQREHNAWQLLRVRPNALQRNDVFIETLIQWALIWGNGVAWTPRRGSRVSDIIPLRPDCLWPELIQFDGQQIMLYHYNSPTQGREYIFGPDEVIHIQGLTGDGIWGYPLWQIAKNTIGQGLAIDKHGNKTFSNGARPSGVLEHPGKLSPDARKNLRDEWERLHSGADNAGRVAVLWEAMKFSPVSMSNVDSEWVEAKKMGKIDAASLLNLPPHKLGYLEDSSVKANLEEQNEVYKQMTLTRWANRMDQEFRRKLLTDAEWKSDRYRFVFDWDAFLTPDIETKMRVGDMGVKAEILNRNEARRMIRMPPYEGGEKFGSPAINPQDKEEPAGAKPAESTETEKTPPQNRLMDAHQAHRELLMDRLLHFLDRESISLKQAASSAKNFVKWLDEFYGVDGKGDNQISALRDTIVGSSIRASCAAGLDARGVALAVANYSKTRHAQLLEACSNVTKDQLPAAIELLSVDDHTLIAQGLLATALGMNHKPTEAA
jgi:HK97 family phage portal protein